MSAGCKVRTLAKQDLQARWVVSAAGGAASRHGLEQRQATRHRFAHGVGDIEPKLLLLNWLPSSRFSSAKFLPLHDRRKPLRFRKVATTLGSHDFIIGDAAFAN